MAVDVFAVPVFFIVFRETLETTIIVSVLLAFLKQTLDGPNSDRIVYKALVKQVWVGTGLGFVICLIIGGALIGTFYTVGNNIWGNIEEYWEGSFGLVACIIITLVGAPLLRVSKMQEKWRVKLAKAIQEKEVKHDTRSGRFRRWCEKYAMFILPFTTVLREGIEAIVFISGVSFSNPASSVPLPVVVGLLAGCLVGYIIYKFGATSKLQIFLVLSTCLLYLVAAGLFSKAVWFFEAAAWNKVVGADADELGSGPGSYDISNSVWHVNYGNPEIDGGGGWGIFNAILGWQNSATYGSVISYNVYWVVVIIGFLLMRYHEVTGHLPFLKGKKVSPSKGSVGSADGWVVHRQESSEGSEAAVKETNPVAGVAEVPEKTVAV